MDLVEAVCVCILDRDAVNAFRVVSCCGWFIDFLQIYIYR